VNVVLGRIVRALALGCVIFSGGLGAAGIAELARDPSPARDARVLEGARREGELNLYTSLTAASAAKVKADFERRYGVRVNLWRASSENILQRVTTESRGGHAEFDVVETNGPEMEAIQREQILERVDSGRFSELIPQALFAHREWVATRLNVFVQCYNTQLVPPADVPRGFDDLLDPKWKGRLAIEANDADWFQSVVGAMGEEKGLAYFRKLVATNGLSVRKGHALLAEMVKSGEIALSLTCYSFKIDQDRKSGAPVDWTSFGPLLARPNGEGISRKAPHPNAALLFYEYMMGEAQPLLAKLELAPVSTRVESNLRGRDVRLIDPAAVLRESTKWEKLYEEIIVRRR
jgi:iron(III) transport system substrate-binding protein